MSEIIENAGGLLCAEAALLFEKRVAEEPLLKGEEQRLREHLAACRRCGRSADWMSALPALADAHAKKRFNTQLHSVYQTLVDRRAQARQRDRRIKIAMAVVATALPLALIFSRNRPADHSSTQVAAEAPTMDCRPVSPGELVPGVLITHCQNDVIDSRTDNDGEVRVQLTGGTVGMLIDPNRPHKRGVIVETPQGEVRVKGTLFTVQVNTRRSLLEVFRGVVEFIPTASVDRVLSVKAGQGSDLGQRKVFPLSSPRTASFQQVLSEGAGRSATERSSSPEDRIEVSSPREAMERLGHGDLEASTDAPADDRAKSVTRGSAARPGTASPPQRAVPGIDRLIHEAQSCLIDRDWACASARYEGLLTHYPSSPESTSALVSLARIELRHLGRPTQALAHLRAYQQQAPDGPMAEEALFGIAVTFRRLGKRNLEQETLSQFIEKFPESSQIRQARTRLRQLESNE